jgi:hypothetical protein
VIGPGHVREQLAHRVAERDSQRHAARDIVSRRSARMTVPQLVARVRRLTGLEPRRRMGSCCVR